MASSLKTGHIGLILLFSILLCVFITILVLSAPSSSFSKVADQIRVVCTPSIKSSDRNDTTAKGKIILKCTMVHNDFSEKILMLKNC